MTDRKLYTTAAHKRVVETIHILIKMGRKRDEPDDKKEKTAAAAAADLVVYTL
jgi:hypothetical protein